MAKLNSNLILTSGATAGEGGRAQILVVDDDRAYCETIARCLAQRGYDVVCADGGEAATEAVAEQRPDLIVTDVMMPGMDGIDLINWLHDNAFDIPVIAISGEGVAERDDEMPAMQLCDRTGGRATAVALGAVSVLQKPFGRTTLEGAVAQALTHGVIVH
ncbi:MAG TPA: response regulator [Hypericibacter adhaerens]|uniref:response regulator n=1 Tax=Hypericibacter adhaerens TaxID=2602016 RepID=UPI002CDE83F7|nr:response regulator [Hypericibacter adhaerens]HWA45066.1 response regulator [Hypericibacter adhaerens]